ELRSFLNLSKAIERSRDEGQRNELLEEWDRFRDERRVERTQGEIISRIKLRDYRLPLSRPRVALILLASRDVAQSVTFYRDLLGVDPVTTNRRSGGVAEFEVPGVRIAIHGRTEPATNDPYAVGAAPDALGWGVVFVLQISEFDRYYENALDAGYEIVDAELDASAERFFVLRDPSGYLIELTEELDPRGVIGI
ncbi:MAG: VOC family protein, partial [Planctomycetota bacterium]